MKLLKRILRHDGINLAGTVSSRSAVRGIIPGEGKRLLMVFSATRGDYKFLPKLRRLSMIRTARPAWPC